MCFTDVFASFILVITLNTSQFMSFVSPGSHIFVDIFVDNYNGVNSYIFVNGNKHINSNYKLEIYKFKAKDSEINVVPICLGTVSKKDISVYTMTKTG